MSKFAKNDLMSRRFYECPSCQFRHTKWEPRCLNPQCNSRAGLVAKIVEATVVTVSEEDAPFGEPADDDDVITSANDNGPRPITEIETIDYERDVTSIIPLDLVLGGGFVRASAVVIAAVPGCGKTSLTLQMLNGMDRRCLYATGEETIEQVAMTARRVHSASAKIFLIAETDVDKICEHARKMRAKVIAVDSIQKMHCTELPSSAGTPPQVKRCTDRLVRLARETGASIWIIGQVDGEGGIAGPRALEHDVDVVLELQIGERPDGAERVLRCSKNRFGATTNVGRFTITAEGLVPVDGDGWDQTVL